MVIHTYNQHIVTFFLVMPFSLQDLSSLIRDQTCCLAVEAWSLNYWTASEVPLACLLERLLIFP